MKKKELAGEKVFEFDFFKGTWFELDVEYDNLLAEDLEQDYIHT